MTLAMRVAITADLHWGPHARGNEATRLIVDFLRAQPPDVLVLAGDVGAGNAFAECLGLFADLPGRKLLVPGNHDIWVEANDARGDSLGVYRQHLPALSVAHGFHYLDAGPLVLPEADLALVGSINWYDYSWSIDQLRRELPDWESRLRMKRFDRGRHNDARFVRWPIDDVGFTAEVVETLERHLEEALAQVGRVIVVTHHPPFEGLNYPREGPPTTDGLLWTAFSGNRRLEETLRRHADRIAFAFCGHTHHECQNNLGPIRGYNVGGDYHFKRLLILDWPAGTIQEHTFGNRER